MRTLSIIQNKCFIVGRIVRRVTRVADFAIVSAFLCSVWKEKTPIKCEKMNRIPHKSERMFIQNKNRVMLSRDRHLITAFNRLLCSH